jgi:hypothetical protein
MMQSSGIDQALILPSEQRPLVDESNTLCIKQRSFRRRGFGVGKVFPDSHKVALDLAPHPEDDGSFPAVRH